ncbi:MAG TPA: carboxypeptidase regulatory-like domain-containing protein, partial [Terriglobales bacterium]
FAALAINNQRGAFSDVNVSRILTSRLSGNFSATQSNYELVNLKQKTFTTNLTLTYKLSNHFSLNNGVALSQFRSQVPASAAIKTLNLPVGIDFSSRHFGGGFQYQSTINFQGNRGNDFGVNLRSSVRQFQFSTFFRRNVQVPTVQAIFAQLPELQDVLERSGIVAATPDQIAQLLRNTALLTTLGFSDALVVNLAPARTDLGASVNWANQRTSHDQVSLSFLNSKTDLIQGNSVRFTTASATYSRRLTANNDVVVSASLFRTQDGINSNLRPLFDVSIRHKFYSAPGFLLPGRHGMISGHVFRDDEDTAKYTGGQEGIAGVEVRLDENRVTRSDANGFYSFNHVPFGEHRIEAMFQSAEPFFFTTNSPATAEINSMIDFGINFQKGQVFGYLKNDAGHGIPGVVVELHGVEVTRRIRTSTDGKFTFSGLSAGTYKISTLPDSYPPGYPLQNLPEWAVALEPGRPAQAEFTVRATRVISGRVVAYDKQMLQQVPLEGITVRLVEAAVETKTSASGAFVFRNLPAGVYTIDVTYKGKEITQWVMLPPEPTNVHDIELNVGTK